MWTIRARWLLPMDGPPLENHVLIVGEDRIADCSSTFRGQPDFDLPDSILLPGFVNAHTHLDLSGMRGLAPPRLPLPDWLKDVVQHRRQRSDDQVLSDIQMGLQESIRFGTTLLGDISGNDTFWHLVHPCPIRAVFFRELIGLTVERASTAMEQTQYLLKGEPSDWQTNVASFAPYFEGLSPHAPYSVRASLFDYASHRNTPVMTHLAESREELELLSRHEGVFVDFLKRLGAWDPDGLVKSPEEVIQRCQSAPALLLAHANYLPAQIPLTASTSVVYCPRTHAAFGHDPYPLREYLARGVRVALGTDSLASNPDLSLLAEARFVRQQFPDLSAETIVRMATLAGAEALGLAKITGSLTPGKSADFVILPCVSEIDDPYSQILCTNSLPTGVVSQGQWVLR